MLDGENDDVDDGDAMEAGDEHDDGEGTNFDDANCVDNDNDDDGVAIHRAQEDDANVDWRGGRGVVVVANKLDLVAFNCFVFLFVDDNTVSFFDSDRSKIPFMRC